MKHGTSLLSLPSKGLNLKIQTTKKNIDDSLSCISAYLNVHNPIRLLYNSQSLATSNMFTSLSS